MRKKTFVHKLIITAAVFLGLSWISCQALAGEAEGYVKEGERAGLDQWEPATFILDALRASVIRFTDSEIVSHQREATVPKKGWQDIMTENFEGLFPQANWYTSYNTGNAPYFWGKDDYNPYNGAYSGWCAADHAAGYPDLDPAAADYANNMSAWMIYGPFSLADATDAEFQFQFWLDSEANYDFFSRMASIDGSNFSGLRTSGNSGGWQGETFDLTDVYNLGDLTGQAEVYIAFIFQSDGSNTAAGAFVDDIVLRKDVTADQPPVIVHAPVTSAQAGSDVTISATITDDVGVISASLSYRQMGEISYTTVAMASAGTQYTGIIPGSVVTAPGVEYYLSASDGTNLSYHPAVNWATQPHEIQAQDAAPVILHTPVGVATDGTPLTITANITDDVAVTGASLLYRRGGEAMYYLVAMTAAGDQYSGVVPGNHLTSQGLEYYIAAQDAFQASFDPPADYVASPHVVRVQVNNLIKPEAQPGGSEQTAYRMFSVPAELNNTSVAAVLEDDLGSYDDAKWRFLKYQDGAWREHPNAGAFAPGQAGWLIVRETGRTIDAGSGTSVSTADSFAITLRPGWNDIAVPFDFSVPWRQIAVDTSAINGPYAYEGQWMLPLTVTYLAPWKGYSINNLTGSNITMKIPPIFGMSASGEETTQQVLSRRADVQWFIQLSALCEGARDDMNFLGCATHASRERDALDLSEPPGVGSYVSLYFPHLDWVMRPDRLATDFRMPIEKAARWEFVVETNINGAPIQLRWDNLESVPASLNVSLLDVQESIAVDLRGQDSYSFAGGASRNFILSVGAAKIQGHQGADVPRQIVLHQNHPNPFNPTTVISYDLTQPTRLKLSLHNILGEQVSVIADGDYPAGHHEITLDARHLAAGVYFYRLETKGFIELKKMVLLK